MKGKRVAWTWRVKLWIHDDATHRQEDVTLDQIAEEVDASSIQEFVKSKVEDWGIDVTVEEV